MTPCDVNDLDPSLRAALLRGETWRLNNIFLEMGAEAEFDYAGEHASPSNALKARLTRCYELAAAGAVRPSATHYQITVPDDLPRPQLLVHGRYSSPDTRHAPIGHAWVVLADMRIWEPISGLIYNNPAFRKYTQCKVDNSYSVYEARVRMLRTQHYGPWT